MTNLYSASPLPPAGWRARLAAFAESAPVQRFVTALIVVNAVTLGLETSESVMARHGDALEWFDRAVLWIFVAELAAKIAGRGLAFFRNGWNLFKRFP